MSDSRRLSPAESQIELSWDDDLRRGTCLIDGKSVMLQLPNIALWKQICLMLKDAHASGYNKAIADTEQKLQALKL